MNRIKKLMAVWMIVLLMLPFSANASYYSPANTESNNFSDSSVSVSSVVYDGVTGTEVDSITEATYVRLKNKWQSNYLYEASDGIVRYGFTSISDKTSEWMIEDSGSYKRIKNRATGHYITSSHATSNTAPLTSEAISTSTIQDQWMIEDASRAGYKTIKSAATPNANNFIHEEAQLGFAQMSLGIGPTFESPQWKFEPVSDLTPVRIVSKTNPKYYLYEDADGLVKAGELPVNDTRSHWYMLSDDGSSTVRMKNRASGNLITQNTEADQPTSSLPLSNAAPTSQQWKIISNGGWLNFSNVDHLAPQAYFLITPNFDDKTVRSIGSAWGRDGNGDDQKWKFETASDSNPTRLVNYSEASTVTSYVYENDAGIVKTGALGTSSAYLWLTEDSDGNKRLRNLQTGHYISSQNGAQATDPLQSLAIPNSLQTDQWKITASEIYDDYKTIQSAVNDSAKYINVTEITNDVFSSVIVANTKPAQWLFEDPSVIAGVDQYIRIQSSWDQNSLYLYEDDNGNLKYGNVAANNQNDQWLIGKFEGRKTIKNRGTNHYMNMEDMSTGHIRVTDIDFSKLTTDEQRNKAKWVIEDGGSFKNIHSVSDTNNDINNQKFLHAQNLTKYAEYGVINRNWTSAHWNFIAVTESPQTIVRIKNKANNSYLYDDSGVVKNSPSLPETDPLSQWFLETSGNSIRFKNIATNHYMTIHDDITHKEHLVNPVTSEDIPTTANTDRWTIKDVAGFKVISSEWSNTKQYANSSTGNLFANYTHDDPNGENFSEAQWTFEDAPPVSTIPSGYIRIKNNGKYLYESNSGVVLYGDIAEDNGYSNWIAEKNPDTGIQRIKNRETGHYLAMNADYSYIESISSDNIHDLKTQWVVEANGADFLIRSNNGKYNDEYVNVKNATGYAERGLYTNSLPSLQWKAELAPSVTNTPAASVDLNRNTATTVFDDSNYITILNKSTGKYLYENNGKIVYGALNDQNNLTSQWLIQDFNGHKLIKNRATGHLISAHEADKQVVTSSNKNLSSTHWKIDDFLGYKKISSTLSLNNLLYQNADSLNAQHGSVSNNVLDSGLWSFNEVVRDVSYEAENAFISGSVVKAASTPNYSGTGYIEHFTTTGDRVIFAANGQTDNSYSAKIHYNNSTNSNQTLSLYVNGLKSQQLTFAPTSSWTDLTVDLSLRAGYNSVSLELEAADSGQIAIDSLVVLKNVNIAYRGANQTYITYEAENSNTNGTILGPVRALYEYASEASGRQAVQLNGIDQHVDFTLAEPANSIVLRYSIPDKSVNTSVDLYVNDSFVKNIALTSKFAWEYGNYPWSKDSAQGSARRFFDETHVLIGQDVPAGATISLRKTNNNSSYVIIDFADMEQVAATPYLMPSDFISITDNGATANDLTDDTAALRATITAAKLQHKGVWIPEGSFIVKDEDAIDPLIYLADVTIRGAGMWHTTLIGAKFFAAGNHIRVYDLAIDGDLTIRDDEAHTNGFEGTFGTGSTVQSVWIEHTKTGMWISRVKLGFGVDSDIYSDGLYLAGLRIRNTMADGINFCINTKNSMVEQTHIRYPGDDGLAMWSTITSGYPGDFTENNTFRFDTVQLPWLADNMVVFGGKDNKMTDNIVTDTINNGGGIAVSTRFDPTPLSGTTLVERNTLVRTGSRDNGLGLNFGAIWVYADSLSINSPVLIKDNIVIDSTYQGLSIQGAKSIKQVSIDNLVIDGTGLSAIEAVNTVSGNITLHNYTIRNNKLGAIANYAASSFIITDLDQLVTGIDLTTPENTVILNGGTLQLNATVLPENAENKALIWSVIAGTGTATISEGGLVTATGEGTIIVKAATLDGSGTVKLLPLTIAAATSTTTQPSTSSGSGSSIPARATPTPIVEAAIKENNKKLEAALASKAKEIIFEINAKDSATGVSFSLEVIQKVLKDSPDTTIIIKNGNASYTLPKNLQDIILNSHLTLDLANRILTVNIDKAANTLNDQIQTKATSLGFKLFGIPVNFQLILQSGVKTAEIKNYGSTYVTRTIELDEVIDGNTATALVFNPDTGEFHYVPALFTTANGKTLVTIKSTTNSIYTVAQFTKSFNDIQNHWAKKEIELLSSKLIVNGKTSTTFAPNDKITRAEFATLLVRALGITSDGTTTSFKDVAATDWFASNVQIAAQFKLITGFEDGSFKPNQIISREQMAVMAGRALKFSNQKTAPSTSGDLTGFEDKQQISSWAQEAAGEMIANGIILGKTKLMFAPKDNATRAETTVILTRLLQSLDLINK